MLKNYFKIAWRNAKKNKSFTLISLFSLVMGISIFFMTSIWVQDEVSYDTGFQNADDVFRLEYEMTMQDGSNLSMQTVGWPVGKTIMKNYPEVESLTYMDSWSPKVSFKNEKYYEEGLLADENFFDVFSYKLKEGNAETALKDPRSIVLSQKLKQKYFGDKNALGEVLMLSDSIPYQITGVLEETTIPSHLQFDLIGSFASTCADNPEYCSEAFASGWFQVNVYNYVRLKPDANKQAFIKKAKSVVGVYGKEMVKETGFNAEILVRPLKDIYLKSNLATASGTVGNIKSVRLFFGVGIIILLLACLNFINLTTASSMGRAREIGIKKVLGGNKRSLMKQFLGETALLCVLSGIISLILVALLLPYFNEFSGKTIGIWQLFSFTRMAMLLGILALLIPLAGFYPAWVMSSYKPIKVLKGHFSHSISANSLRKGLVVSQFAISVAFIISTIIMVQQINFMQDKNLGFDKNKVLIVSMSKVPGRMRSSKVEVFKNSIIDQKGIKAISAAAAIPGTSGWESQFAYPEGRSKEEGLIAEFIPVDFDYLKTLGLELAQGRDFIKDSKMDEDESLIINEAAVKSFGWGSNENAIGKKLETSGKDGKVIGVLKDYNQHGLQSEIKPLILAISPYRSMLAIRYDNISASEVIASITKSWNEAFKDYTLEYRFMDEILQKQYEKEQKLSSFFEMATFLSILIACLGLLGLSIHTAQKRIKEIGIRKVLGASIVNIVAMLSKDFLKLVAIAILIAVPIAWFAMDNWLHDFAYKIGVSWLVFAGAGLAALGIAILTIGFQAIKAAIANPVKSLRTE